MGYYTKSMPMIVVAYDARGSIFVPINPKTAAENSFLFSAMPAYVPLRSCGGFSFWQKWLYYESYEYRI
jgi:hypothetical protein